MKNRAVGRSTAILLLPALAACVGPAPYDTLGRAGRSYAAAGEQALVIYRTTYLDARSEAVLNREIIGAAPGSTDFDLSACRRPAAGATHPAAPLSRFARAQCDDVARVRTVSRLIDHMRLLGRYFEALSALATSNAPAQAEASAGRIVGSLTEIGKQLDAEVPGQLAAVPPLANLGFGLWQRAALREELERHGDTIRRELAIEAKLLDWLGRASAAEQTQLFNLQFQRRVVAPIATRRAQMAGDQWLQDRRALLLQVDQASAVAAAEQALGSLAQALDTLLRGGDADQQLGQLVADVNLMLSIAEPFVGRN